MRARIVASAYLVQAWDWLSRHRLRLVLVSAGAVLLFGVVGYMVLGGLDVIDALYMAVITITTVGFEDLASSSAGRLFTVCYIIMGVAVASATLSVLAATLVEGQLRDVLGRKRMERQVLGLSDHIILCGFGRFGQLTASRLRAGGVDFVVLDNDPKVIEGAEQAGEIALLADATEEGALERAGIHRARALLLTLPTDAENVYVILNAREVRPDKVFPITALARDRSADRKLRVAGATHVVSPYAIGSSHMARQILMPHLAQVMNIATGTGDGVERAGVGMEEFPVSAKSKLVGVALKDSPVRRDFGVIIVATIPAGESPKFNPGPDLIVRAGDVLIAVGEADGLRKLRRATQPDAVAPTA